MFQNASECVKIASKMRGTPLGERLLDDTEIRPSTKHYEVNVSIMLAFETELACLAEGIAAPARSHDCSEEVVGVPLDGRSGLEQISVN